MSRRIPPTSLQQWLLTLANLWLISGLFLDGWAHLNVPELETFFTPWHAVFYSGYASVTAVLIGITLKCRRMHGGSFRNAIPLGYGAALVGTILFAIGGIGDLLWHETFGIEIGVEALLSPTHLILAVGGFTMLAANLRAWAFQPVSYTRLSIDQIPMLFSATYCITLVAFMTQFTHYMKVHAGGTPMHADLELIQSASITGYLLHTSVLIGTLLFIAQRARQPLGAYTLILAVHTTGMALLLDTLYLLPGAVVAGIVADFLGRNLLPFEQHHLRIRVFAFGVPATLFLLYFLTIAMRDGIWWSVHMWTGSIVMAGLAGLLISYLFLPHDTSRTLRA
jgi:hypothetical protein